MVDDAAVIRVLGLYQLERSDHTVALTAQKVDMALDCVGSVLKRGLCLLRPIAIVTLRFAEINVEFALKLVVHVTPALFERMMLSFQAGND